MNNGNPLTIKAREDAERTSVMNTLIWETCIFFSVQASFFYPAFSKILSRIYGFLCVFIGIFF